jgi:Type IV secretion system pilin
MLTSLFHLFAAPPLPCAPHNFFLLPTWYEYLKVTPQKIGPDTVCTVAFNFPGDFTLVLLALVDIALRIAGIVAVAYVVYGGVRYTMSQGEPDKTKQALHTIINALVGAALSVVAAGLVVFIGNKFGTS